ncbi:MAG: AraC family transcriptional regulator [Ignavibacteria bacterium]
MILRKYPESISSIKNNYIVHFTSAHSGLDDHISPLSIKCSMKGNEFYKTPGGDYKVSKGSYLILNNGQLCQSSIKEEAETFCVFFEPKFVNDILMSLVTPSDKILNFSFLPNNQPVLFLEKLYPHNHTITPVIMKIWLASKVNYDDENFLTEQYYELLKKLLLVHRDLYEEIEKLPPVKLSTKIELYKRVCRAKEFIDSSFTENITLEKISKEACLSQFHFLRLFKTVYKETPHQYLTQKRVDSALNLLRSTDKSITEICFDIGFESVSSFSWLFRRNFGLSPEVCRGYFRKFSAKYKSQNTSV